MNESGKSMIKFRESFRGYNKDDVNSYLEQMSRNFAKSEEAYKKQINDMKSSSEDRSKSGEETEALKSRLIESLSKIEKYESRLIELEHENESLNAELAQCKEALDAAKENADAVKEEESSEEKTEEEKSSGEKAMLYDSVSSKLGDIMITAKASAQSLIGEAEAEAEKIKADALEEANKIRENANAEASAIKEKAKSEYEMKAIAMSGHLKSLADEYVKECDELVSQIKTNYSATSEKLEQGSRELLEKMRSRINL